MGAYGTIGGGIACAPAMEDMCKSYLAQQATVGGGLWEPDGLLTSSADSVPAPVLTPASEVPSVRWAGNVVRYAGNTCVMNVTALHLSGNGAVNEGAYDPELDNGTAGQLRSPIGYVFGAGAPAAPIDCWVPVPRLDPTNWEELTVAEAAWCALPCYVAVGTWCSADAVSPPYVPTAAKLQGYVQLPELYILLVGVPAGKAGAPQLWVPFALTTNEPFGLPTDLATITSTLRAAASPWIDGLEAGSSNALNIAGGDGPSYYRRGRAQEARLGLR